jgi:hypothetical protein
MNELIKWFVIVVLLVGAIVPTLAIWNYAVAVALIYIVLRTPMQYAKKPAKR